MSFVSYIKCLTDTVYDKCGNDLAVTATAPTTSTDVPSVMAGGGGVLP